jgi:hypothetical protein
MRIFSSGPWHLKQLSERMGRISRLKSTGLVGASAAGAACVAPRIQASDAETSKTKNSRSFKFPSLLARSAKTLLNGRIITKCDPKIQLPDGLEQQTPPTGNLAS